MSEFVAETREMLDQIAEALVAWEVDPAGTGRLDEIFRFVHTVKGSCGFLDLPRIQALAHAAETALAGVRDGTRPADGVLVGTMLAIIDRIGVLVASLEDGKNATTDADDDDALLQALERRALVAGTGDPGQTPQTRSIRVAVPLLEAMMNQVSDLVLVRNELARALRPVEDRQIDERFARLTSIVGELRDSVTRTRMQPIDRLFATLPRLVRDTARESGKSVTLEIVGHDVEIDREMVEAIRDPLIHMVRNAIDHGIERPIERAAIGKAEHGHLKIVAQQSGNQVIIAIEDDGRGIDASALLKRAVASKRVEETRAAAMTDAEAIELVFQPGLSTAAAVSTVSGRGVGMDIVRANVERLGGSVALANRPGKGLTITVRAPLTLSIVNALVVRAGGRSFAIPRASIEEVVALDRGHARLCQVGGGLLAIVRDRAIPAFSLGTLLEFEASAPRLAVVIETPGNGRYALGIDEVGNHEELVVRPMASQIASAGVYAGQTLGDDGLPLALLDPIGLAARGGLARTSGAPAVPEVPAVASASVIVATSLDGRRVALRTALVERAIETQRLDWTEVDGKRFVNVDGRHAPAVAQGQLPDVAQVFTLMLCDGCRRVAYAVQAVQDLIALPELVAVGTDGVEGLFQHDGVPVLLLEGLALFAHASSPGGQRPVAALALDSTPWARALLAPLVAAAGYEVRFGSGEGADLVLSAEGEDVVSPAGRAGRYDAEAIKALLARTNRRAA